MLNAILKCHVVTSSNKNQIVLLSCFKKYYRHLITENIVNFEPKNLSFCPVYMPTCN